MNAWATINKKYSEPDGPLVMSYSGSAFLMAAELMDDTSVWDADEKRLFKDWVTSVYRKATNEIREPLLPACDRHLRSYHPNLL